MNFKNSSTINMLSYATVFITALYKHYMILFKNVKLLKLISQFLIEYSLQNGEVLN